MIYLVYFYLFWSSIAEFIIKKSSISVLSYVDETIVIILTFHLIIYRISEGKKLIPKISMKTYSVIFVLISFLSVIVNRSTLSLGALYLFSLFKPILLFFWIITFSKDDRLSNFTFRLLAFLIVIQLPFFLYGLAVRRFGYIADNATGATITGDAFQVAVYMWLGIIFSFIFYILTKKKIYIIYTLVCLILLIITSTKQLTFILPVILFFLLRNQLKIKLKYIIIVFIVVISGAFLLYSKVEGRWSNNFGTDYSQLNMADFVTGSEKVQGYYSAIFDLPKELPVPLLGAGPGEYGSYVAMNARTLLSEKYIMYFNDLIPAGLGGTLSYRSSSLIALWGDSGIFCLILYIMIYIVVLRKLFQFANKTTDPFYKCLALVASAAGIAVLLESVLLNIFEGNWFILNFFWILSGSVLAKQLNKGNIEIE
jgi:hypothetical protein